MADVETQQEELDPRVKIELERLNTATDEINSLELQLDEARAAFRAALTESTSGLNTISKKLGSCIEKARPYYDAKQKAKELQSETQKAAVRFERANSMLSAAKEMVDLAEQGLMQEGRTFDANWQEMLNHATMKVGEADKERWESECEHQSTAARFDQAERDLKRKQRSLRSAINKSRIYFEMKNKCNSQLEEQKKKVSRLEERVGLSKGSYSSALRNLEQISDEIHMQRRTQSMKLGERGMGVGAESSEVPAEEKSPGLSRPSLLCTDPDNAKMDLLKGYIEGTSKEEMHLVLQKSPVAQRPQSQDQDRLFFPDPHSILQAYESTGDLDDMSDTASFASELSRDRMDDFDDRGLLSVPAGASGGSSREVSPAVSVDVSPAMSRESSQNSSEGMAAEADRKDREERQDTEGGGGEEMEEELQQVIPGIDVKQLLQEDTKDAGKESVDSANDGDLTPVADAKQIKLELDEEESTGNTEEDQCTPTRTRSGTLIPEHHQDASNVLMDQDQGEQIGDTEETLTEETQTDEQELDDGAAHTDNDEQVME